MTETGAFQREKPMKKRTVTKDLVISLATLIAIISVIAISVNYLAITKKSEALFSEKVDDYASYLIEALELPLWDFNVKGVESICVSFAKNDFVGEIVVKDIEGAVIFESRKNSEYELTRRSETIAYHGTPVGTIELGLTPGIYKEGGVRLLVSGLTLALINIVVLVLATAFLLKIYIRNPFDYLVECIDQISKGDYRWQSRIYNQPEIQEIISKFECMARQVEIRETSLKEAKLRLEKEIDERKRAEEQRKMLEAKLIQAQKLEALGTLAGGLAHDFNNMLMGIQGRTSLMLLQAGSNLFFREHLEQIEKHVESASSLTSQLLSFARGGKCEPRTVSLNSLIEDHHRMFCRTRKEISYRSEFAPDLWTVEADSGQMQQVLMNVYVNACQAMPDGGELFVRTENAELDQIQTRPYSINPGKFAKLSVADTGTGIDPDILPKIFDPFFTTKCATKGNGLGLASVYGIVKNHGGFVNVRSKMNEGSTFEIYLPASEKEPERRDMCKREIVKGTGAILLVDDEEIVIEVSVEMLEILGYSVKAARDGMEAVRIFEEEKHAIDLVIIDMVMPSMDGGRVFDEIKRISPKVKTILATGYSMNRKAAAIMERGCDGFLQKPFSLDQLSSKLRDVME